MPVLFLRKRLFCLVKIRNFEDKSIDLFAECANLHPDIYGLTSILSGAANQNASAKLLALYIPWHSQQWYGLRFLTFNAAIVLFPPNLDSLTL